MPSKPKSPRILSPGAQAVHIADVAKDRVDGLNPAACAAFTTRWRAYSDSAPPVVFTTPRSAV